MSKNLLSNEERLELHEKYKKEKLNNPPPNIKDETLIANFGTDEQKARLQESPAAETQQAVKDETGTEAGDKPSDTEQTQSEINAETGGLTGTDLDHVRQRNQVINKYRLLHGVDPESTLTTDEISALNVTAENEADDAQKQAEDNKALVSAFNTYTELHGKLPAAEWGIKELEDANAIKRVSLEQEAAEAEQIKQNMKAQGSIAQMDNVTLVHKETREKIIVSRHTWDNFISKNQPEFMLAPEPPAEIKPPVETVGK